VYAGVAPFICKCSDNPLHPTMLELRLDQYNANGKKGFIVSYNQGDCQSGICLEPVYDADGLVGFNVVEGVFGVIPMMQQVVNGKRCSCNEELPKDLPRWCQIEKGEDGPVKVKRRFMANELFVLDR
jgi:hypothetical protein